MRRFALTTVACLLAACWSLSCSTARVHRSERGATSACAGTASRHEPATLGAAAASLLRADGFRVAELGGEVRANRRMQDVGSGAVTVFGTDWAVLADSDSAAARNASLRFLVELGLIGSTSCIEVAATAVGFRFSEGAAAALERALTDAMILRAAAS